MRRKYSDFDQLGHIFGHLRANKKFSAIDIEFLHCEICDIKVWIGEEEFWIFKNFDWNILNISCEEMQIKNLLE